MFMEIENFSALKASKFIGSLNANPKEDDPWIDS